MRNGIIIADTKFEFGVDQRGELVLADEVFTPDSSRYWPADEYRAGVRQHSFDKQFVRNWLTDPDCGWDRYGGDPPPPLPPDIVDATRARYIEAYERISGRRFADWIGLRRVSTGPQAPQPKRVDHGARVPRRRVHRPVRVAAGQVQP